MQQILEVKNLTAALANRAVLKNISFELFEGEFLALVGASGSGKTTIANAILQLQPKELQVGGSIIFEGKNLLEMASDELQKIRGAKINMIFQDPASSLNPTLTVGYQITEGLCWHKKVSRAAAKLHAIELLTQVGITNPEQRLNQYPHELSGGMRQRVIIAMALCCDPQILIADEPTSALDMTVQAQILNLLKELQEKLSLSMLLITHDLNVVEEICDRAIILNHGKIVETATVKTLFNAPQTSYTRTLIYAR